MQDPSLPQLALTILTVDFLRYALAAGTIWLLVSVVFGRRLVGRRILDAAPQPGQVRREFIYSLSTVLIFAANGLLVWLLAQAGTLRLYTDIASRGWAWWWFSLVLIIVAHDAYFYWTHRWLHHRRWFRAVHGRHHASLHPTPWAAYAFHPIEALVQAAFLPLFLLAGAGPRRRDRRVPAPHDPAQRHRALCPRAAALALDATRLAGMDHARQPPPLPPRAQPRQLRPVLHLVGPLVWHRRPGISAPR